MSEITKVIEVSGYGISYLSARHSGGRSETTLVCSEFQVSKGCVMRLQYKQSDAEVIQALHTEGQGEEKSGRWFMVAESTKGDADFTGMKFSI